MGSWGESVKLKVTGFDKTEEEAGIKLPNLSYDMSYEEYYPQTGFSWYDQSVKIEEKNSTTVFTKSSYWGLKAIMENLETILIDGRNAPHETLFKGHYVRGIDGFIDAVSYVVEKIENDTGKVLFHKEIDTIPDIIHDVSEWEKEHLKEPAIISSKEKMLELMSANPAFYNLASPSLKEDEELALKAVKELGTNYQYLLDVYKKRREFQLAAVVSNSCVFDWLPEETQADYGFLLEACKGNEYCLDYVRDEEIKKQIGRELKLDDHNLFMDDGLPF